MQYVTYDLATGDLTGAYIQSLLPEHEANHIEVDDAAYSGWVGMRVNATVTGLEPKPSLPAPPPVPIIPAIVTNAQARRAIIDKMGPETIAQIDSVIDGMPEPAKSLAFTDWNFRQTVERDNTLVQTLAAGFGWDAAHLDDLFTYAGTQ